MAVGVTVMLSGDARAQGLDISDPDSAGESLTKCFHPGDRHVRTTVKYDTGIVAGAFLDCVTGLVTKDTFNGRPVNAGYARTTYRGGWTNMTYNMNVSLDAKFVCSRIKDDARVERYARAVNTRDDKPGAACFYENWRLIDVQVVKSPAP
jgi:hypothetical protein